MTVSPKDSALRLHYDCVSKDPLKSAGGSSWLLLPSWTCGLWPTGTSVSASPETSVITLSRKKILLPVFSSELKALMGPSVR